MRPIIALAGVALLSLSLAPLAPFSLPAAAQESCTGDNCPPPQSPGGHECESKKNEDTIS